MLRLPSFLAIGILLLLSGCTAPSRIATSAHWQSTTRAAPRPVSTYHDRVARDVDDYVDYLDRRLRLTHRQERHLQRNLERAAHRLLDRTHPRDRRYVYPFPRRFEHERNRAVARWWDRADHGIERVLSRRQRIEYRRLTHPRGPRYRQDRRYEREQYDRDRYDDRDRSRRYDRDDDWDDDDWDDDDWEEWDDDDRDDDDDDGR